MSKDTFFYSWLSSSKQNESSYKQRLNSLFSKRAKKLLSSHQLVGNFFHYRTAIKILGLDYQDVVEEGRLDLNPSKWADFGPLNLQIGPPSGVVKTLKNYTTVRNLNFYPPNLIPELKKVAGRVIFKKDCDKNFEIVATEGTQSSLAYSLLSLINPQDEVIITDPGYFFFEPAVIFSGGKVVKIKLNKDNNYRIDIESLKKKITKKTKVIIVCDPINPFGTIQTKDELKEMANIANKKNIVVINNITHSFHRLDPCARHFPMSSLQGVDLKNVLVIAGLSHGFGLAGLRIGFLGGDPKIIGSILATKSIITRINISLMTQYAAIEALKDKRYLQHCENILKDNLEILRDIITNNPPLNFIVEPKYGFFVSIDTSGVKASAQELTVSLLKRRCAVYPSDGLGDTNPTSYLRINFSTPNRKHFLWLKNALPEAIKEAESGMYRKKVINFFKSVPSLRAKKIVKKLMVSGMQSN
jgi:aspartate/methionine/tyrosine aminotransferase